MPNLLIIDDDPMVCSMLAQRFENIGHTAKYTHSLKAGLELAQKEEFDVVLLDIFMPDGNGLEMLSRLRQVAYNPEVIVITGLPDADGAERAIRDGAWDYCRKGASVSQILVSLEHALRCRAEKRRGQKEKKLNIEGIVAKSAQMQNCIKLLAQAVESSANVLITGETGTGKELFARAVHYNSERSKGPFVVVDCAALPENLVESMLLGHERGSFTGADSRREGLIKQADGGTLFLDEVGELPLALQKAFLRVLHERCFRPIGSSREVTSNFRLIAATNRNLEKMSEANLFRQDLLFRIKALTIELPPLRERRDDLEEIVRYFVKQRCKSLRLEEKQISSEFVDSLSRYSWPGNVRELIHAVDGALSLACHERLLYPNHLPTQLRVRLARAMVEQTKPPTRLKPEIFAADGLPNLQAAREAAIAEAEAHYLKKLLALTEGNIRQACRIADLSRSRLYALMKKYSISKTPHSEVSIAVPLPLQGSEDNQPLYS